MELSLLLATIATLAPAGPQAGNWRTYSNVRYAYSICYPAQLKPGREADNGDGRAFKSADGITLKVWGGYNVLDEDVEAIARRRQRQTGGGVTYAVQRRNWYVFSARVGSDFVYERGHLANGTVATFQLRYPAKRAAAWKPVVERLSNCLSWLRR